MSLFHLSRNAADVNGNILFTLDENAYMLVNKLIDSFLNSVILPSLPDEVLSTKNVKKAMLDLPLPPAAKIKVKHEITTSGDIIFSPNIFKTYLEENGFIVEKNGTVKIIIRVIQWVAFSIYQTIQEHRPQSLSVVSQLMVIKALHEDEILSNILRGMVFY